MKKCPLTEGGPLGSGSKLAVRIRGLETVNIYNLVLKGNILLLLLLQNILFILLQYNSNYSNSW